MGFDLDGYVDVAERIRIFRDKYPEGSLQPLNHDRPLWVEVVDGKSFVCYAAAAYRTADDVRPGVGIAWEPFPGPTPYTKDSEAMNAETAAWGRAIVATLAADTKKIASAEEVRNRAGGEPQSRGADSAASEKPPARPPDLATKPQLAKISHLVDKTGLIPQTWPLPDTFTKREASTLIDELSQEPVEPPAQRVGAIRDQLSAVEDEFLS